jgi:ribonuclease T1
MPGVRRAVRLLPVLALLLVGLLTGCSGTTSAVRSADPAGAATGLAPLRPVSDLPTVAVAALPPQAVRTLEDIASGGPFPYAKDGSVFQNREGNLPSRPTGFYREYTVEKPGEDDRGPWRIVAGDDGSRFWTQDHYASFEEVVS